MNRWCRFHMFALNLIILFKQPKICYWRLGSKYLHKYGCTTVRIRDVKKLVSFSNSLCLLARRIHETTRSLWFLVREQFAQPGPSLLRFWSRYDVRRTALCQIVAASFPVVIWRSDCGQVHVLRRPNPLEGACSFFPTVNFNTKSTKKLFVK